MSVLSRPQKEWDDFLERAREHGSGGSRLFWILIAIAVVGGGLVLYLLLT